MKSVGILQEDCLTINFLWNNSLCHLRSQPFSHSSHDINTSHQRLLEQGESQQELSNFKTGKVPQKLRTATEPNPKESFSFFEKLSSLALQPPGVPFCLKECSQVVGARAN